ncbi:DUF1569 domain-containing protein [Aureibaculum sp. 2210JD6-5]|uniref:DUF1569 domain-containing protein n=1 Tax=Aureibaculum sp. 2210JD6-5 TaxID=3103957 RepID=UPI002AAE5201|nr:DUF1569 domain-containing protein [Aureibaculum sp. 2210JD6-5]MDY7393715.1 DUF1569 domain-containing protein [Aureibaculum sp. 2210JD6-5]
MPLLKQELSFLEKNIKNSDGIAANVSSSNVAWHIDHSLKVINRVCNFLIASDPNDYKWRFNKLRFIIFLTGVIPRGKARAPKQVRPPEDINIEDLEVQLKEVQQLLMDIEKLHPKNNFDHHIFGKLHLKKTIRFLEIHTNHHIKIIKDILKAQ